jgi:predicted acetyltransferase
MTRLRTPRPPALRYRAARRTDVETLADLGFRAYRVHSLEKRREFYTDHPRFTIKDVRVGELEGQIVASLVLYPLTAWVRGQRLPVAGVGSVAVSPEHRRRGIGETLMRSVLRELRQTGQAFSMLYPFRGSFYRRFGYGMIEQVHQIAISPKTLPASEEARGVRRLMLPDRPAVQGLYDRIAEKGHFALARKPEWWTQRLWDQPGDWVVFEGRRRGQIEGYLYYEVDSSRGPFALELTLKEFVATSPEAHRGLVGYLASLADQVAEIEAVVPADGVWLTLLASAENLKPGTSIAVYQDTGNVGAGAMLRVTDVKAALERFPVAGSSRGEVVLEVEDALLPQNARGWRVSAREGRLKVGFETARKGVRPATPRVKAPVHVLSSLLAGALSPAAAAEAGLVESRNGGAEVIEHWFRTRPAFLHVLNAF